MPYLLYKLTLQTHTSMFLPSKLYKIEKISKKLHFFYKNICVYEKKVVILQAFSRERMRGGIKIKLLIAWLGSELSMNN